MLKQEAKERVARIKSMKGDNQNAHIEEDKLYVDFIRDVAKEKSSLGKVAKVVISTQKIDFSRWCA